MASVVSLAEEAKGKAVKTRIYKVCPLLNTPCIKDNCEWFAVKYEACAMQVISAKIAVMLKKVDDEI